MHARSLAILLLLVPIAATAAPATRSVELNGPWKFALDPKDIGKTAWAEAKFDDSAWKSINVPGPWETQGYPDYNGVAWYRRSVTVPAEWRGQSVFLVLPAIDETDDTFFNGVRVGGMKNAFLTPRLYRLDDGLLKFGEPNLIAVRVTDHYGNGGMSRGPARLIVPGPLEPKPIDAAPPATLAMADLAGWKPGWRDEGTSDTRPKLHARPSAFEGKDGFGIECWFPNSGEYVEHKLDLGDGSAEYISFWCKGSGTAGEMNVALSSGNFRWQGGGSVYTASFFVTDGQWQHVILPFSAFIKRGSTRTVEPMPGIDGITMLSIGYENNALRSAGEVQFAGFETGRFAATAALPAIDLGGLWQVSAKRDDPSPTWAKWGTAWTALPGMKDATEGWFRQTLVLPEPWKDLPLEVSLGKFGWDTVTAELWINGRQVGTSVPKQHAVFHIEPSLLHVGENAIAVRVMDDKTAGRSAGGPYAIKPVLCQLGLRDRQNGEAPAEGFQQAALMGRPLDVTFTFAAALPIPPKSYIGYELIDCFHRPIQTGLWPVNGHDVVVAWGSEECRRLYLSEQFSMRATLFDANGQPLAAFADPSVQMKYDARDALVLRERPPQEEDTPYGKLKLIDEIDAATDTDHPYKEGGIRASWVGRRAYSTWERGISVNEFQGRKYREANNNEWFGYRVGRGKITPHAAYVLRVEYPEDKARYMVMNIDASRNYQGKGFKTGASPNDPNDPYPLSGKYEWCDHFVFPDDTTYGYRGSRTAPGENGFWVFFHDNGRLYTPQYQAGPAVARIKLYEITDFDAALPKITLPHGQPHRTLMADWEREPEAVPLDTVRYAKLMGWNAISPETLKWGSLAFFRSKMDVKVVKPIRDPLSDGETPMYDQYLAATRQLGLTIIPRLEYGGTDAIPKAERAIGADGKTAAPNRFHSWCADLLQPVTASEMAQLLDEVVGQRIKDNPQIGGVQWRIRSDRLPISYSPYDLALFEKETGTKADLKSVTKGDQKRAYEDWWHAKRRDFQAKLRDQLRGYRPDLKLYYYNWDPDGWSLGKAGLPSTPADWTLFYNVHTSKQYYDKELAALAEKKPDYLALFLAGAKQKGYGGLPHHVLRTDLYKDVDGIALLAPLHWHYLADNDAYVNYFRTGDGLAVCNMFNYEEKGRWNVQGDNYESSEMTPAGPTFAMAEEVLACFHGDPTTFTSTTYTFGRSFAAEHRRFAQAFLALPAKPGKILSTDGDVRIRQYDGGYIGVVNKGYETKTATIKLDTRYSRLTDLVTGKAVPAVRTDAGVMFEVPTGPMSLNSYLAE